jgi:hypothetical protein
MSREMCGRLERWLQELTTVERRVILKLAAEVDADEGHAGTFQARLLAAVACEVRLDVSREDAVLYELAADHRRHVEEVAARASWPVRNDPPRTQTMYFDPETGESRVE